MVTLYGSPAAAVLPISNSFCHGRAASLYAGTWWSYALWQNHTSLGPPARQLLQRNLPLLAKRKNMPALEALICANRGRNLGPHEHVGLPTLCQSGKYDLVNLRRWQGRSFSVPESFGAGASLQRCLITWHLASHCDCTDWWSVPNCVLS